MKTAILCLGILVASSAMAGEGKGDGQNHPCKKIRAACEAAGFTKGGHKSSSKGLWADCIKPTMDNRTPAGVTVAAVDVVACKAKKAAHKEDK
ncbi:MAG: hypothetical protein HYR96_11130 [Deltaproteobacteria bacterium]|nr:hypothetical protein [Deltaproteobacteria bacterium]MBI3293325.1 hypothetical protein [Deltaproteobacteria bacterium]